MSDAGIDDGSRHIWAGAFWTRMRSDFHAARLRNSLCTHVRVLYRIMVAVRILVVGMSIEFNASGAQSSGRDVNRI